MGLEVSRLARNPSDWHRLLEFASPASIARGRNAVRPAGFGGSKPGREDGAESTGGTHLKERV